MHENNICYYCLCVDKFIRRATVHPCTTKPYSRSSQTFWSQDAFCTLSKYWGLQRESSCSRGLLMLCMFLIFTTFPMKTEKSKKTYYFVKNDKNPIKVNINICLVTITIFKKKLVRRVALCYNCASIFNVWLYRR